MAIRVDYTNQTSQNSASIYDGDGKRKYLNQIEREDFYVQTLTEPTDKKLFLHMLLWTGVRISEALNLKVCNIDFSDKVIAVKTLKKRRKKRKLSKRKRKRSSPQMAYRHILLPPIFLNELQDYVVKMDQDAYLWKFSRRSATRYVKKAMNKAELSGSKACARGLRHSFAVTCVIHNLPLSKIKNYMGHASLETTAIYLNIIGEEERKLVSRMWSLEALHNNSF